MALYNKEDKKQEKEKEEEEEEEEKEEKKDKEESEEDAIQQVKTPKLVRGRGKERKKAAELEKEVIQ